MTDPIAHHLTWHTYGTWLHGDDRGSFDGRLGRAVLPDSVLHGLAASSLVSDPVRLSPAERRLAADIIIAHTEFRQWPLHAVNVLAEHVHVVVTLPVLPMAAVGQFKSWASRRLNERFDPRPRWWAAGAGIRVVWDQTYFDEVIAYVVERQEPSSPGER